MNESYDQHIAGIYTRQFENKELKLPFGSFGRPLLCQKVYLPEQKDSNILDAGCGNGIYALNLVNNGFTNIYGFDLFEKPQYEGFSYTKASLTSLPYNNDFFDFIYSFSVIYYLPDPEVGIKEFYRVLKPGKNLIITAHTKYSFPTIVRVLKRFLGINKHLSKVHFHSTSYYINLLRKNGFEIVRSDGYLYSPGLYTLYLYFRKSLQLFFKIQISDLNKITRNSFIARIKSEMAYHSIIVVRKPYHLGKLNEVL
jgi:ubiquinone/menaquinone biosynthesis C-methylase UbiE